MRKLVPWYLSFTGLMIRKAIRPNSGGILRLSIKIIWSLTLELRQLQQYLLV